MVGSRSSGPPDGLEDHAISPVCIKVSEIVHTTLAMASFLWALLYGPSKAQGLAMSQPLKGNGYLTPAPAAGWLGKWLWTAVHSYVLLIKPPTRSRPPVLGRAGVRVPRGNQALTSAEDLSLNKRHS